MNKQLEQETAQLNTQVGIPMMTTFRIDNFKETSLEKANELHTTRQNIYLDIQELQDYYSTFHHFKIKAR